MIMEDESVVLLGIVQERHPVDASSPYICKAGGRPAWYGQQEPAEAAGLTCPKCQQGLFLVAQVYAPVEIDRTLYVFGCNTSGCTETTGSWRVLRDQPESPSAAVSAPAAPSPEPAAAAAAPAAGGWAVGGDDDSDWSDDDDEPAPTAAASSATNGLDALELLLQQRDDALTASSAITVPTPTTAKLATTTTTPPPHARLLPEASHEHTSKLSAFPSLFIDVIEEPYEDYTRENDYSHENELLQAYLRSEEEEKSTDVSDLRKIIANTKKPQGGDGGNRSGGGAVASGGESYERTPAQQKHFMRFQKRISRCPLQVLRYDYGGEPLWPMPATRGLKVPRCSCGEDRVFEFQLTPTINYFLKVDEFAPKKLQVPVDAQPTAEGAVRLQDSTGGGMDWSSVVIYSCPKSCASSHEEVVHVLPPQSH